MAQVILIMREISMKWSYAPFGEKILSCSNASLEAEVPMLMFTTLVHVLLGLTLLTRKGNHFDRVVSPESVSIIIWAASSEKVPLNKPKMLRFRSSCSCTKYHLGRRRRQHSFVEIDHEIFSTVILSLPLIQEGQLSVSGERMCTILVNRLED